MNSPRGNEEIPQGALNVFWVLIDSALHTHTHTEQQLHSFENAISWMCYKKYYAVRTMVCLVVVLQDTPYYFFLD